MKDVRQMARVWAVLAMIGLFAALVGACGGGGEEPAAGESPTPSAADNTTLAPCRALDDLKAYHYSVSIKVESPEPEESPTGPRPTPTSTLTREFTEPFLFEYNIDASFVAPDRTEASISGAGEPFSMIVIGNQTWVYVAHQWSEAAQPTQVGYPPTGICEAVLTDLDLSQTEPLEETANDVKSLHYTFSQVSSENAMARIFGAGSDMDILIKTLDVDLWLAEKDEYTVRMDISGSGLYADGRELRAHVLVEIRDANSADIQVEPPA